MRTSALLVSTLLSVALARPSIYVTDATQKRELPQEHSHEAILRLTQQALLLNNPAGITDAVFGLLQSSAAEHGKGNIGDVECLQQATADQALTNAKIKNDVALMVAALQYRTLERDTDAVGQKSLPCTSLKADNPEIAALYQHQDPASADAAANNKNVTTVLAQQIASLGGDPVAALDAGTFAPGKEGQANTCNDENDTVGCIISKNLIVHDLSVEEIKIAVANIPSINNLNADATSSTSEAEVDLTDDATEKNPLTTFTTKLASTTNDESSSGLVSATAEANISPEDKQALVSEIADLIAAVLEEDVSETASDTTTTTLADSTAEATPATTNSLEKRHFFRDHERYGITHGRSRFHYGHRFTHSRSHKAESTSSSNESDAASATTSRSSDAPITSSSASKNTKALVSTAESSINTKSTLEEHGKSASTIKSAATNSATAKFTSAISTTTKSTATKSVAVKSIAKSTDVKSTAAESTTAESESTKSTAAKLTNVKSTTVKSIATKSTATESTTADPTVAKSVSAKPTDIKSTTAKSAIVESVTTKSASTKSTLAKSTDTKSTSINFMTVKPTQTEVAKAKGNKSKGKESSSLTKTKMGGSDSTKSIKLALSTHKAHTKTSLKSHYTTASASGVLSDKHRSFSKGSKTTNAKSTDIALSAHTVNTNKSIETHATKSASIPGTSTVLKHANTTDKSNSVKHSSTHTSVSSAGEEIKSYTTPRPYSSKSTSIPISHTKSKSEAHTTSLHSALSAKVTSAVKSSVTSIPTHLGTEPTHTAYASQYKRSVKSIEEEDVVVEEDTEESSHLESRKVTPSVVGPTLEEELAEENGTHRGGKDITDAVNGRVSAVKSKPTKNTKTATTTKGKQSTTKGKTSTAVKSKGKTQVKPKVVKAKITDVKPKKTVAKAAKKVARDALSMLARRHVEKKEKAFRAQAGVTFTGP